MRHRGSAGDREPVTTHDTLLCTVIVVVDADADVLPALAGHAQSGLERFPDYPGFRSGALHLSDDGCRMIQYLQWESVEAYRACVDDPAWDALPSTRIFMEALASGRARMDERTFRVVSTTSD